jgi:signal transduction histidine kinase
VRVRREWLRMVPTAALIIMLVGSSGSELTWLSASLAVGAVVASLPLVWADRVPEWILATGLLLLTAAGAILSLMAPAGFALVLVFVAAAYSLRHATPRTSAIVVPFGLVATTVSIVLRGHAWLDFVATIAGFAALALAGQARRQREARIEQTELALANAQTAREEHAVAAALAERARIAREMHDVLAHSLAGLALNLQGARLVLVRDGASQEAIQQVERAQKLASEGLAEARRAVAALRSDERRLIPELVAEYGPEAHLEIIGTADLSRDTEETLYRAAQETLTNVRKHAPGAQVEITLQYGQNDVTLTVTDRGGTHAATAKESGYGLTGMRERAELLGGTLDAGPVEDGWRVRLTVPQ